MMIIISLALIFILKLRFPSNRPIAGTLRSKYGGQAVHNFRRVETLWRKRDEALCDMIYMKICYNRNSTPKFLRIKLYKRNLQRTLHVRELQRRLLERKKSSTGNHLQELQHTLTNALSTLQASILQSTLAL